MVQRIICKKSIWVICTIDGKRLERNLYHKHYHKYPLHPKKNSTTGFFSTTGKEVILLLHSKSTWYFLSTTWGIFHYIHLKINYIYPLHFDGSYNLNFKMTISTFKSIFNQLSCICRHFGGLITTQKGIRI